MSDDSEPDLAFWRQWLTDRMAEAGLDAAGLAARYPGWLTPDMVQACLDSDEQPPLQVVLDVAEALGVPGSEAVAAAGWSKFAATMAAVNAGVPETQGATRYVFTMEEFLELPIPDDVKQNMLARLGYGLPDFMPESGPAGDADSGEAERRDDA